MAIRTSPGQYCPTSVVDHNQQLSTLAHMDIRKWKALKATAVSLFVALLAAYTINQGADPDSIGRIALATLALVNGIELGELLAVLQTQTNPESQDGGDDP